MVIGESGSYRAFATALRRAARRGLIATETTLRQGGNPWPRTRSFRRSWRKNSRPKRTRPICGSCAATASTSSARNMFPICCTVDLKPWPRRGDGAKGVFINHEASRTSNDCYVCEIAPGKKLEPRHHLFEEMIMILVRPRLDHGLEQCRRARHLRMEGRLDLRDPAQLLVPALQRLRAGGRAARRGDQFPVGDEPLRGRRFRLQLRPRLQEPLLRRAGLFRVQGRAERLPAAHQFRRRRHQPAADHRQGARRRRRPHPLQHGQGLDREPHLAVPGRHLQEGACARPGRACDRAHRRRLFADVAGGRGAASATTGNTAR